LTREWRKRHNSSVYGSGRRPADWEHERKYEQSKREYLGDDVLKDPGSAVVWWLTRNDDQVEKTVQNIGLLATLSSAANNTDLPETFRDFVPRFTPSHAPSDFDLNGSGEQGPAENGKSATDHFDDFLRAMNFTEDDPQRDMFAHQVAEIADEHGRPEVADELKRRFEPPRNDLPEELLPES
jgi:hypothetical protein